MKHIVLLLVLTLFGTSSAVSAEMSGFAPRIACDTPAGLFESGRPCEFRLVNPGSSRAWTLTDWESAEVAKGAWPADGRLSLGALPPGYYELTADGAPADMPAAASRFAFTVYEPVPPATRRANRFFAVDSALSWISRPGNLLCPWHGGDSLRLVAEAIAAAGFNHARERLGVPTARNYGHYLRDAEMFRSLGISVGGMFHHAGKDLRPNPALPRNLSGLYGFCAETVRTFGDRCDIWEFWNEPDIHYAPEPAWTYAAATKAAYLGFKAGRPEGLATMGALLRPCERGGYCAAYLANDIAYYTDAFMYHVYDPVCRYPERFACIRERLAEAGVPDLEIRVSECGTNLIGPSRLPSASKGIAAQSSDQERILTEFYPKSQILLQMEGVTRCDYFVFGAFLRPSGQLDRGVFRRDGTAKPIWAAMRTLVASVGDAELEGKVRIGEGRRAYVYRKPDGTHTLAFWKYSKVDLSTAAAHLGGKASPLTEGADFSVPAADGEYEVTDIVGRRRRVSAKGGQLKLRATAYPSYVAGLGPLEVHQRPFPRGRAGARAAAPELDLTTIVAADLNTNDFTVAASKDRATLRGASGRIRVEVWNLSKTPRKGALEVTGGVLEGVPAAFEVPPMGNLSFAATYRPAASSVGEGADATKGRLPPLTLRGIFDGRPTTHCIVPQ